MWTAVACECACLLMFYRTVKLSSLKGACHIQSFIFSSMNFHSTLSSQSLCQQLKRCLYGGQEVVTLMLNWVYIFSLCFHEFSSCSSFRSRCTSDSLKRLSSHRCVCEGKYYGIYVLMCPWCTEPLTQSQLGEAPGHAWRNEDKCYGCSASWFKTDVLCPFKDWLF